MWIKIEVKPFNNKKGEQKCGARIGSEIGEHKGEQNQAKLGKIRKQTWGYPKPNQLRPNRGAKMWSENGERICGAKKGSKIGEQNWEQEQEQNHKLELLQKLATSFAMFQIAQFSSF